MFITIPINAALLFIIRSGLLLVLLTPLVVTQSTLYPYVVGKSIYARTLIEIVFACWLVLAMRDPSYRVPRSWILRLFAIYVFVNLMAALAGVSFQRSFWGDFRRMGGVFDLAHWFSFAVVLVSAVKGVRGWYWLLSTNLFVSMVLALLGLAQQYNIPVLDGVVAKAFWYLKPSGRADITLGNPTYVGAYAVVNFFIALALLFHSTKQAPQVARNLRRRRMRRDQPQASSLWAPPSYWRAFWAITAVLNLWVMTLSGTRGALVGLATAFLLAGIAYLVWGTRGRLKLLTGAVLAALTLVVAFGALAKDTPFVKELARANVTVARVRAGVSAGLDDSSVKARINTSIVGLRAFIDSPLLGWGPENFAVAFDQRAQKKDFFQATQLIDQAHNKPVEELTTKGILGFASYVFLVGRVLWVLALAVRKEVENQWFSIALGAALIAYLVQDVFLFDTPATVLQFMLLLGWAAAKEVHLSSEAVAKGDERPVGGSFRRRQSTAAARNVRSGPVRRWQSTVMASTALLHLATVSVLVLMGASLYFLNYRPYRAAQLLPLQGESLEQFIADARRSFQVFPPLANLGRQILLDTARENWNGAAKGKQALLLQQLESEGEAAMQTEPQNARFSLSLARLFGRAGQTDPVYLPVAGSYLEVAQRLAPAHPEVVSESVRYEMAKKDYAQALTKLYAYTGSDPVTGRFLASLEREVEGKLMDQIGFKEYFCRWEGKRDLSRDQRERLECQQAYYQAVFSILGPSGVVLPLVDRDSDLTASASFTTRGADEVAFKWSKATALFDTAPAFQDQVPLVTFNGKEERAVSPNAHSWSAVDGRKDGPLTIGAWVKPADSGAGVILSKYNWGSPGKEWVLHLNQEGLLTMTLQDESKSAELAVRGSLGIPKGCWSFVAATYSGNGLPEGVRLYVDIGRDKKAVAKGGSGAGDYVAMKNTSAPVSLGAYGDGAGFFSGQLAGGPIGPFYTRKELTPEKLDRLYVLGRAILGYCV